MTLQSASCEDRKCRQRQVRVTVPCCGFSAACVRTSERTERNLLTLRAHEEVVPPTRLPLSVVLGSAPPRCCASETRHSVGLRQAEVRVQLRVRSSRWIQTLPTAISALSSPITHTAGAAPPPPLPPSRSLVLLLVAFRLQLLIGFPPSTMLPFLFASSLDQSQLGLRPEGGRRKMGRGQSQTDRNGGEGADL